MKQFNWKVLLPYCVALAAFFIFTLLYCRPIMEGKVLNAGDIHTWAGAAQEVREYKTATGETSWWTNSMFGGMPTFQISGSTPANTLRGQLESITHFGFKEEKGVLGILLAYLIEFFLMLRCFRINKWLSITGAFALTLSTYFMLIIPAGHVTKANAIGLLAPVIGGIYAVFRKDYWLGVPLVLFFGIIGITLHPQMTYYVMMLIGVMVCAELYTHISEKRWKDLGINIGVLALCAMLIFGTKLSWFQMNNEYLKETMRGGHSELNQTEKKESEKVGLDIDYATAWSYGKAETFTFLVPNLMGGASGYNVGDKSLLYEEMVQARIPKGSAKRFCQSVPTYWGEKAFTSGPVYMGAIICFLFILGLIIVPGTYKWALLFATICSVLLAWGRNFMPLTQLFYDYFPMYNKFRAVESILIVAEITMPLLGMLALNKLYTTEADKRKEYSKKVLIAGGITGGICLILALFGSGIFDFTSSYDNSWKGQVGNDIYQMIIDQRAAMLKSDAWRSFGFISAACVLIYIYTIGKLKDVYTYTLLAALILTDMVPVNRRFFGAKDFVSKKDNGQYFAIQPWEEEILRDNSLDYRVLNVVANTFNDSRTSYRCKSIGGYSAVKLRRYQDLIDAHISKNNWNVINMLNTKYLVTRDGVRRNGGAMGNAWLVDEVQFVDTPDEESQALWDIDLRHKAVADKRFADILSTVNYSETVPTENNNGIEMTSYAPNKLEYVSTSDKARVGVFSEIYYPNGWHLYIDGEEAPIGRVNYILRAAVIPAGEHILHWEFVPDALKTDKWCMMILILSLLISGGMILSPLYKDKLLRKQNA